jgi:hypothetical protein
MIVQRDELAGATEAQMYRLFCSQFDNVSMNQFVRDLDEKNWVLLLRDTVGELNGFSSMHVYETFCEDRQLTLVYSGDTVVDRRTWSDSALSYNWMGAIDWLQRRYDKKPLYWFLLVSGFRTYRFLPVFSRFFYPRFDESTPGDIQALMHSIARERFNGQYDPGTGIVRLNAPSILKGEYSGIPEHRLGDPHIAYFAERNPGHEQGDELVCFCELAEAKLTGLGQRMWRKGRKLFAEDT